MPRAVNEAGTTGADRPEAEDGAVVLATVIVWGIIADGVAAGRIMNWPAGLYRIRKSMAGCPSSFGSPRLISSRLACRPRVDHMSRLVCAAFAVIGFTNTRFGSRSECSAENDVGSPTPTELIGSGIRIAVT